MQIIVCQPLLIWLKIATGDNTCQATHFKYSTADGLRI